MAITISDTEPRVQYTATAGQTSFSVPFEFFTNSDIKVYNGTTLLTFNASPSSASQYSVTGAGVSGGGSITLGGSGATLNDIITIYRDLAIARSTDFPTSGAFQISSLNTELDKIIAMCQQLERDLKFSPRAAATTSNTFDITFPNMVANKVLTSNSDGTALEFTVDKTDVATVAGISNDVTTVSGISANVTTVAGVSANVTTVASNISNVNTVANNISDIVTVANDLNEAVSEIETVASDLQEASPEIDTVATNINNINTVAGSITNVNTVAGNQTNINTVAAADSNITTVAGANTNITTVAGSIANVNTVASANSNISTVATNITNVNTVASNITGLNSFAERYRVESSDPSTSLDEGDLVYNTSANALKYYNGSSWVAVVAGALTDVIQDGSPQLGGNLDLNSNDITGTGNINITGTTTATTFSGSGASLTSIPNSALDNNSITINGSAIALGGSVTVGETKPTVSSVSPSTITNAQTSVTITGTNFLTGAHVEAVATDGSIIAADTISFTNSTTLVCNFTIATDASYFIRVENTDGNAGRSSTAILTVSDAPTWTTSAGSLGSIAAGDSVSLSVAATSDSTVAYSETTSVLTSNANTPAGTMNLSLNSSTGAITGTAPSPTSETTYNFTLRATDNESQTADRAFSITVTVGINNGGQFN